MNPISYLARRPWNNALDRDLARRESADENRQFQLCQIMWSMRHVVLLAAFIYGVGDGSLDRQDVLIGGLLVLQAINHVWTRLNPALAPRITLVDALVLIAAAYLGLPSILVFILGIAILGWAATFRPLAAISAYLLVASAAVIPLLEPPGVPAAHAVTAFCMLGLIFMVRAIRLNMGARVSAEREQLVAERIDAIMWEEIPGSGGALKVTPAAERLLGYPVSAWSDDDFLQGIVHPDDRNLVTESMAGRIERPVTARVRRADGAWRWLENRTNLVAGHRSGVDFRVGVLLDRTEQVEAEQEALSFGHLVASSPIGQVLLRCDGEGPVIDALNQTSQRILGLDADAAGTRFDRHVGSHGPLAELSAMLGRADMDRTIELLGADGRVYQATARRIDAESCSIDLLDITERVESGRRLHAQARQDHLTGLPNRRAFIEALDARLALADRPRTSVLIIDLDRFKDINDSLGHDTGDDLLRHVGERICGATRVGETAARLGGDEFAVVLPDLDAAAAMRRATELVEVINQPVNIGDLRLRVFASVGHAGYPADATDSSELMRCADVAMYHAKKRGTQVEQYDGDNAGLGRDRLELVADLEQAILNDQLFLHHQPLLDMRTGRIIGSEVLARWQHPRRGLMSPDTFIELAEVSGQMKSLTRWVIRRALNDLRQLGQLGEHMEVSVNLSVRNLYEPDFLSWLSAQLRVAGVLPSRLVVEITETMIMDDPGAAIEMIGGLGSLGVRTWIDDFGTGHSSFARLRSLPVQGIKIDRSFLAAAATSETDRAILSGMIELVRSLRLNSVAEGVESSACLELLGQLGCDMAQGYHIGRPMPLQDLQDRLRAEAMEERLTA